MAEGRGQAAAASVQAAGEALLAEVASLPVGVLVWKPAPDVWTVMDILCHVEEFVPYWIGQTTRAIAEPGQPWGRTHAHEGRMAAVTDTDTRRLSDVVGGIRRAMADAAERLAGLSDASLLVESTSRNPRWGRQPAQFIVDHLVVEHIEKHIGQIRRNLGQYEARADYLFAPAPQVAAAVRGTRARFPIRRIFCVGRNYEAHAREMGAAADRETPFYFTKSAEHYLPSGATVAYPPGTKNYHYEMELVAAIGKAGFRIPATQALEHVFGYACGLDMTRRDLQVAAREKQRPWDLGKDVEDSAVLAEIVPATAIGHPSRGRIELRVNGETKQASDISMLIHDVGAIVAHLSQFYHLHPGDLVYTGTPEGVGALRPGDRVEGSIEGVGAIALHVGDREV